MLVGVGSRFIGSRWLSMLALVAGLLSQSACRDPAELAGSITATLIVVDVEAGEVVDVTIADRALRARPGAGDNLVSFNLPLAAGTHVGDVVVSEVEDEGEEPKFCGQVTIVVPDNAVDPVLVAVVAEDLGECVDDDLESAAEPVEPIEPVEPPEDPPDDGT